LTLLGYDVLTIKRLHPTTMAVVFGAPAFFIGLITLLLRSGAVDAFIAAVR
jgi:hypothetical protein